MSKISVFQVAKRLKPVLKAFIPDSKLRAAKERMIDKKLCSMAQQRKKTSHAGDFLKGVNLIGDVKAEIGLGQSCRLLADMLKASGIDFKIYDYRLPKVPRSSDPAWDAYIGKELPYSVNLIHINPFELKSFFMETELEMWQGRYNIGFWLWELEEFPDEWLMCTKMLDEIWTPSEFAGSSIRRKADLPVKTIPYWVTAPCRENCGRAYFGLPQEKFLFLAMYDCNSTIERKNPIGTIEAYKKAFPEEDPKVGLVLKMNNAREAEIALIKERLKGYNNVYFITDILEKTEVNSLIKCVDVFSSLHRAEGFGLVLAEAMIGGTPVIATNWSSNTEFMDSTCACMVDYGFVQLEKDSNLYKKGSRWADPDISEAAEYMKRLYSDRVFYEGIQRNAKEHVEQVLGKTPAIGRMERRLHEIIEERQY